ncbi:MAG: IS5 family transposase [Elusimicrobiota bacterium]
MYKENDKQNSFFGDLIYETIVPKDHFLRRLTAAIDFSFVNELCKELYSQDNGRPCWEPQVLFKVLLLQYLYNLSDTVVENEICDRLSFKWFLGIDADDRPPDATTLVRFRDRLGTERFAKAFNHIVETARKSNLVSDQLHIVDATTIKAKVDIFRIHHKHDHEYPNNDVSPQDMVKHSPDKDARFGYSTMEGMIYGYKGYVQMDKDSEIIVSSTVDSANKQEYNHLEELIDGTVEKPEALTADKAYDTRQVNELLIRKDIRSGVIHKKEPKKPVAGIFYQKTPRPKEEELYFKRKRLAVEHKIAELKRWHNLRFARFIGLIKTKIQMFLTCIAVNVKRIVKLISQGISPPWKNTVTPD